MQQQRVVAAANDTQRTESERLPASRAAIDARSTRPVATTLVTGLSVCGWPTRRDGLPAAPIRRSVRRHCGTPVALRDSRWSRSPRRIRPICTGTILPASSVEGTQNGVFCRVGIFWRMRSWRSSGTSATCSRSTAISASRAAQSAQSGPGAGRSGTSRDHRQPAEGKQGDTRSRPAARSRAVSKTAPPRREVIVYLSWCTALPGSRAHFAEQDYRTHAALLCHEQAKQIRGSSSLARGARPPSRSHGRSSIRKVEVVRSAEFWIPDATKSPAGEFDSSGDVSRTGLNTSARMPTQGYFTMTMS